MRETIISHENKMNWASICSAMHGELYVFPPTKERVYIDFLYYLDAQKSSVQDSVLSDVLTKATVENVIAKIMNYAARPLSEFNKFEALDMVENLNNVSQEQKHAKHAYHRMVYETLRG